MPDSSIADTKQRVGHVGILLRGLQKKHLGTQSLDLITISAGIAHMPEHGTTKDELLQAADEALYSAKNAGRDRIVIYQKSPPL